MAALQSKWGRSNITPTPIPCYRSQVTGHRSRPVDFLADAAAHHPVPVAAGHELQLLEMGDALAVGRPLHVVREVGAPVAALRPVGVENPLQGVVQVAERSEERRVGKECRRWWW